MRLRGIFTVSPPARHDRARTIERGGTRPDGNLKHHPNQSVRGARIIPKWRLPSIDSCGAPKTVSDWDGSIHRTTRPSQTHLHSRRFHNLESWFDTFTTNVRSVRPCACQTVTPTSDS